MLCTRPRSERLPTRNVVLTDHQHAVIESLVDSGRYQNASEVLATDCAWSNRVKPKTPPSWTRSGKRRRSVGGISTPAANEMSARTGSFKADPDINAAIDLAKPAASSAGTAFEGNALALFVRAE